MADDNDVKIMLVEMARDLVLDIDAQSEIRGSGLVKVENYLDAYAKAYSRLCAITGLKGPEKAS